MKKHRPLLIFFLMVAFGCAPVGPNYKKPETNVPPKFGSLEQGTSSGDEAGRESLVSWWKILKDPYLNSLMDRAFNGNLDLRIAEARLQQSRALSLRSEAALLPEGAATGAYYRIRRTQTGFAGQPAPGTPTFLPPLSKDREGDLFQVGFDASWEIDIFGGLRREIEATGADLSATEDFLRDTLVSLQGEVARNYIEFRGLQKRLEIARQDVESRRENFEIADARLRAGLVDELDAARAKGEWATAESRIPPLENSLRSSVHRLGVLLGLEPLSLLPELKDSATLPTIPENLPAGVPSELLRRRPDIRRAERDLAAATARIGVSTADLFPRFTLFGTFGFQSDQIGKLFTEGSNYWRIGPSVRWSILNFKRILANIEVSKAVREETLAKYEKSILLSLEEVENALVTLSREKKRLESLAESTRANELAVELARQRYVAGLQDYLAVVDAQTASYTAQDQYAQSLQNHALAFISLYKALGGGWREYYEE
jgi:outer membrane protein, multidrug efflux system